MVRRAYPKTIAKVLEDCKDLFHATELMDLIKVNIQIPPRKSWDVEAGMEVRLEGIYFECIHHTIPHQGLA